MTSLLRLSSRVCRPSSLWSRVSTATSRSSASSSLRCLSTEATPSTTASTINVTFVNDDGNRATVSGNIGETLLQCAHRHGIPIDGACGGGGGSVEDWGEGPQCPFCHVYVSNEYLPLLQKPSWREDDILEDVLHLKSNSRLACQIELDSSLEGMTIAIPEYPESDVP